MVGEAAEAAAALLPSCEKGFFLQNFLSAHLLILSQGSHRHCKETAAVSWSPDESGGAAWGGQGQVWVLCWLLVPPYLP